MDNESRLDSPSFSRCSLGNGRWFWVTWADFESICEGRPHSTGVASSAAEAERQANDSLTTAFGPGKFHQHSANFARHVHRRMAIKMRAGRSSKNTDAAQLEFVYRDWCSDYDGKMGSSAHRVVKKTSTRVYVENRAWSWEEDGKAYHDVETFVLDRQKLEVEGDAYSRRQRNFFYTTPYERAAREAQTHAVRDSRPGCRLFAGRHPSRIPKTGQEGTPRPRRGCGTVQAAPDRV